MAAIVLNGNLTNISVCVIPGRYNILSEFDIAKLGMRHVPSVGLVGGNNTVVVPVMPVPVPVYVDAV